MEAASRRVESPGGFPVSGQGHSVSCWRRPRCLFRSSIASS